MGSLKISQQDRPQRAPTNKFEVNPPWNAQPEY